jgi:hypothetical protein
LSIDPLETLAAANPVSPDARTWISTELGLDAIRPPTNGARDRRRRVLPALGAAGLLAAALVVAPALGLGIPGIDFLSAEKAPPRIVKSFAELGEGAPAGMNPNVIPGETRKVMSVLPSGGVEHTLWVAPTVAGGLCVEWESKNGGEGGCDSAGEAPLSITWSRPQVFEPPNFHAGDFRRITGFAHSKWVDDVEIHLSDGSTVEPSITWVSAPISAGFFFYEPPAGLYIRSVVGLRKGEPVTDDRIGTGKRTDPAPSPFADLSQKRELVSIKTQAGRATVWEAPTKTDETCRWVDLGGARRALTPCLPKAYDGQGLPATYLRFGDLRLVALYAPRYTSLQLRFRDGAIVRLRPKNGAALYEVRRVTDSLLVEALDGEGKTILTLPVSLKTSP